MKLPAQPSVSLHCVRNGTTASTAKRRRHHLQSKSRRPSRGWEADHVEPGVSAENKENDVRTGVAANTAFNVLSCVGNEAIVVNGDGKGARGVVTGKHGGIEHVLIDFPSGILDKLVLGDKILVKAFALV